MLPIIALLVLIAGIFVYVFSEHSKVTEIGRIMIWTSLLVCLLSLASWHAIPLH